MIRKIDIGAEISGHVFVNDLIYVLRGTEQNGESWTIARLNPRQEAPEVKDVAVVPFPCRSLTFDGQHFWTNQRAATEIADRLARAVGEPVQLDNGSAVHLRASIGIALAIGPDDRPETLIREADVAMYRAKRLGDVPWVVYERPANS